MQEVAGGQRFCNRCGVALESGQCPGHGYDVSTQRPTVDHTPASITPPAPWWPPAPPVTPVRSPGRGRRVAIVAVVFLVALIGDQVYLQRKVDGAHGAQIRLDQRLSAQLAATNALAKRVGQLETQSADPATVARVVLASVFTIETPDGLGSGWVVGAAGGSSTIVTDYHVVQSVWTGPGAHTVQVKQNTTPLTGTITKVDKGDDLAAITVNAALVPLSRATSDAMVGDEVFVAGSPLGLSGTVANGIVSAFRNGLIQFSAPISPGDSGGPVVNQSGRVIGAAESKLTGSGVEGLSFAIPITTVCSTVTTC